MALNGARPVLVLAAATILVLLIGSGGYGPHRDELYFLAAGQHLAIGYPDQGPLTPAFAGLVGEIAPASLLALRLAPALAIGTIVILAALLARELGGGRRAELIAAACVAVGSVFLITGHLLSTTTFDLLVWTAVTLLVTRAVRRGDDRLWIWAGLVLGVGLLNKPLPAFLGLALLAGVLIAGPGELLRNRRVWAGAALALAIFSPWVIWQAVHGWPQIDVAESIAGGGSASSESRWAFLPFQLLLVSPLLAPVWIAGLWRLLRAPGLERLRFLAWAWIVLAAAFIAVGGKPYYLAGMFPVLLGAGAISVDRWLGAARPRVRTALLGFAIGASALVSATLALPILPARDLGPVLSANEDAGETVGWPELTATVARAYDDADPRGDVAILAYNYGEAGAVDRYGPELGLPPARSGHNGFWEWGPPPESARRVIAVGFPASRLGPLEECRITARIANDAGIDNEEQGRAVRICDAPAEPWAAAWPGFQRLG